MGQYCSHYAYDGMFSMSVVCCRYTSARKNPLAVGLSSADLVRTRELWVGVRRSVAVGCRHGIDASAGDFGAGTPETSEKALVRQMAASVDEVSSSPQIQPTQQC